MHSALKLISTFSYGKETVYQISTPYVKRFLSARNCNGQADRIKSICPLNFFEVEGGGHKNGVNIVELWSKDYIHVDKLPLNL